MSARTRSISRAEARRRHRLNPDLLKPEVRIDSGNQDSERLRKRAYDLAVDLGLEIYTQPPEGGPGCTSWRWGQRSSADQYAKTFDNAQEAAIHFLTTREAQNALKRKECDCLDIISKCRAHIYLS